MVRNIEKEIARNISEELVVNSGGEQFKRQFRRQLVRAEENGQKYWRCWIERI